MAVHNVRFATTAYTHMYENDYIGRPEEKYRRKDPNELTSIGQKVESWRASVGLEVKDVCNRSNDDLPKGQKLSSKDYWAFVRGQRRITDSQIRSIARTLGTTLHVMTHYYPGQEPTEDQVKPDVEPRRIKIDEPAVRAARKKKAQGTPRPKPVGPPAPYDPDVAAQLLARKYGDRVKRA